MIAIHPIAIEYMVSCVLIRFNTDLMRLFRLEELCDYSVCYTMLINLFAL